jgi:hypothetical protein
VPLVLVLRRTAALLSWGVASQTNAYTIVQLPNTECVRAGEITTTASCYITCRKGGRQDEAIYTSVRRMVLSLKENPVPAEYSSLFSRLEGCPIGRA